MGEREIEMERGRKRKIEGNGVCSADGDVKRDGESPEQGEMETQAQVSSPSGNCFLIQGKGSSARVW